MNYTGCIIYVQAHKLSKTLLNEALSIYPIDSTLTNQYLQSFNFMRASLK